MICSRNILIIVVTIHVGFRLAGVRHFLSYHVSIRFCLMQSSSVSSCSSAPSSLSSILHTLFFQSLMRNTSDLIFPLSFILHVCSDRNTFAVRKFNVEVQCVVMANGLHQLPQPGTFLPYLKAYLFADFEHTGFMSCGRGKVTNECK